MDEDLATAISIAEDMADLYGPSLMTDAFWVTFRELVVQTAMAPVVGAQPN